MAPTFHLLPGFKDDFSFSFSRLIRNFILWNLDCIDLKFMHSWMNEYAVRSLISVWIFGAKIVLSDRYIAYYSTTQTTDAVYIIGGNLSKNLIAEFKNDQWTQLDDLNTERNRQGSISIGTQTMIIGGSSISSS